MSVLIPLTELNLAQHPMELVLQLGVPVAPSQLPRFIGYSFNESTPLVTVGNKQYEVEADDLAEVRQQVCELVTSVVDLPDLTEFTLVHDLKFDRFWLWSTPAAIQFLSSSTPDLQENTTKLEVIRRSK